MLLHGAGGDGCQKCGDGRGALQPCSKQAARNSGAALRKGEQEHETRAAQKGAAERKPKLQKAAGRRAQPQGNYVKPFHKNLRGKGDGRIIARPAQRDKL